MEAVVARPELTSQSGHGLRGVLDNAPAVVGFVSLHIVEEVVGEDCLLSSDEVLLLLVLNITEMHPSAE